MKKENKCRIHNEKKIEMTKSNYGKTYLIHVCVSCWADNEYKEGMQKYEIKLKEYQEQSFFSKIFNSGPTPPSKYEIRKNLADFAKYNNKKWVREFKDELQKNYYKLHAPSDFDFISKMKGIEFEDYMQELFKRKGYSVTKTPASGDYGVDLLISKKINGREVRTAVQCKRYSKSVGVSAVQEVFSGKHYYKCKYAIVVTTSTFTSPACKSASELNVELWDRYKLIEEIERTFNKSNKITVSWEEYLYMHTAEKELPN